MKIAQSKLSSRYQRFNSISAATVEEAFRQINQDKGGIYDQIINTNSLSIYKSKNLINDLKQELMMILFNYAVRDGDQIFLDFYNLDRSRFRYWITNVAKYQFKTDNSPVYRKLIHHRRLQLDSDSAIPEIEDTDDELFHLDQFCSKEIKLHLGQILYSPKAQAIFYEWEIELFLFHYFAQKNKRNYALTKLSNDINVTHTIINLMFNEIKSFLISELNFK